MSALTAMRFAIRGREVTIPDLVGKTEAEAKKLLQAAGFNSLPLLIYLSLSDRHS